MKVAIISLFFILGFFALSCSTECSDPKTLNPNGDSELALLMRLMYEDGIKVKAQIQKGEKPTIEFDFEKIHTAQATDPAKMKTPEFDAFASSYVQAVNAYQNAGKEEAGTYFNGIVTACMNCHNAVCPGPRVRIKKMFL